MNNLPIYTCNYDSWWKSFLKILKTFLDSEKITFVLQFHYSFSWASDRQIFRVRGKHEFYLPNIPPDSFDSGCNVRWLCLRYGNRSWKERRRHKGNTKVRTPGANPGVLKVII